MVVCQRQRLAAGLSDGPMIRSEKTPPMGGSRWPISMRWTNGRGQVPAQQRLRAGVALAGIDVRRGRLDLHRLDSADESQWDTQITQFNQDRERGIAGTTASEET
jgi:hypothetical protein